MINEIYSGLHFFLLFLLVITILLCPYDCFPSGKGGRLLVGLSSQIKTLDSQKATSLEEKILINQIQDGIFEYDANNQIIPVLATSLPKQEEQNHYIVKLKQDIYFHDGTELDGKSVHYTLNRLRKLFDQTPIIDLFNGIETIKSLDKYTLLFVLRENSLPLEYLLSRTEMYPLSESSVEQYGDLYGKVISIGTGPFRLIEWAKASEIILERNPKYWNNPYPFLYKIDFIHINEDRLKALRWGKVHLLPNVLLSETKKLQSRNIKIVHKPGRCLGQIYLNISQQPFINIKFREAVALSINKKELIDTVFDGYATPATSCLPPWKNNVNSILYTTDLYNTDYNLEKARKLIEEIKYEKRFSPRRQFFFEKDDTLSFDLMYTNEEIFHQQALIIQNQLSQVGIEVNLRPLLKKDLFDYVYGKNNHDRSLFQSALEDWEDWEGGGDERQFISKLYYSNSNENKVGLNNPVIDQLIEEASRTQDLDKRENLFRSAAKKIDAIIPCIYLYFSDNIIAFRTYVKGVEWNNLGQMWFEKIYIQR
ncbi:MAG: ABC transporter substrate-binding protein [bacterium]